MTERAVLTTKDIATELGIGQDAAYAIVRQIGFRVGVNGGVWRVRREALEKWIEKQERGGQWEKAAGKVSTNAVVDGGATQIRSKAVESRRVPKPAKERKSGSGSESDGQPIRLTQPRTLKRSANG